MGNHEIRLRRKNITSRHLEKHKNYYEVMRRHRKRVHSRRLTKTLIYILFVLGLVVILYFAMNNLERVNINDNSGRNNSEVLLKMNSYGKEKEPPEKCLQINPFMV